MEGYLRKLKTNKRRYFVLQTGSAEAKPCLEYYGSEKKYSAGASPRRTIYLDEVLKVCRLQEKKYPYAFAVCTEEESLGLIADSEEDLFRWFDAIEYMQGEVFVNEEDIRLLYSKSWHISVKARGIAVSKGLQGVYDMCLAQSNMYFIDVASGKVRFSVAYMSVRKCGYTENKFYFEVGADDGLGPGEVWIEASDDKEAEDILRQLNKLTRRYRRTSSDNKSDISAGPLPRSVSEEPVTLTDVKKCISPLTRVAISDLGPSRWARSASGDSGASSHSSSEFHIDETAVTTDNTYQFVVPSGRPITSEQSKFEGSRVNEDSGFTTARTKVTWQSSFDEEAVSTGKQAVVNDSEYQTPGRRGFQKPIQESPSQKNFDLSDVGRIILRGKGEQLTKLTPSANPSAGDTSYEDEPHYKLVIPTTKSGLEKAPDGPKPAAPAGIQFAPSSNKRLAGQFSFPEGIIDAYYNTVSPAGSPRTGDQQIAPSGGSYYKNLSFKEVDGLDRQDLSSHAPGAEEIYRTVVPSGKPLFSNGQVRREVENILDPKMPSKDAPARGHARALHNGRNVNIAGLSRSILERDSGMHQGPNRTDTKVNQRPVGP